MKYLVTLNGNEYEVEVGADSVTLTAERIGAVKAAPAPAPVRPAAPAAPAPTRKAAPAKQETKSEDEFSLDDILNEFK